MQVEVYICEYTRTGVLQKGIAEVAYEDRACRVLQEGVLPDEQGRPVLAWVIHEMRLLEDVVHWAHEGQLQSPTTRRSAPVQWRPACSALQVRCPQ